MTINCFINLLETLNLTRTIGITIYCYEINFIVTSKSRTQKKQLIDRSTLASCEAASAALPLPPPSCAAAAISAAVVAAAIADAATAAATAATPAAASATAFCCLIVAFQSPSRERVLRIPPPGRRSPSLWGHARAIRTLSESTRAQLKFSSLLKCHLFFSSIVLWWCVLCHS